MRICNDKHRMNRRRLPFQYTDSEHTNPVLASVTPPYRSRLFVTARGGPDKKGVKDREKSVRRVVLFHQIGRIIRTTGWRVNPCRE